MTSAEFQAALHGLRWKQADFCRMAGIAPSTASRWVAGTTEVPPWVPRFLGMVLEVKRLHDTYVVPPKASHDNDA